MSILANGYMGGSNPPTSIEEAFSRFLSSLELTDPQSTLVAQRHNSLRERILQNAPFKIEKTILYGSYERSSQIRPRPVDEWTLDVDIFVILANQQADIDKYHKWGDGGHRLLDDLKKSIDGFQGLDIEKDAPAICIKWRATKMKAEITPAFRLKNGFIIPSASWLSNTWKVTDPVADSEILTARNKATDGALKPFTKAMKTWNRKVGKILPSYAIEVAAFHSIGTQFLGLEYELTHFFERLLEWDGKLLSAPSGIGDQVKIDLGWNKDKVQAGLERVRRAYSLQNLGKGRAAVEEMATVFGKPFPLASEPGLLDWLS